MPGRDESRCLGAAYSVRWKAPVLMGYGLVISTGGVSLAALPTLSLPHKSGYGGVVWHSL